MDQRITKPTSDELARIEAQREWVRGHYYPEARHKYATVEGKLVLVQTILDAGWIEKSEAVKLRCLGITLGDALAQELQMEWVTVEDEYGRTPALRFPGTTVIAFPLTMISKRVERDEAVVAVELFEGVCEHIRQMKSDPNYQRH